MIEVHYPPPPSRRPSAPRATLRGFLGRVWPWLAALAAFALVRALQIHFLGPGIGNDIHLYRRYAAAWGGGAVPYVGFEPEYPPGALPLFLAPFLCVGAAGDYGRAFAVQMGLFDLGAFLLVLRWGRRLRPDRYREAITMGALYLATSAALYPVLYTRFDIVPGALVLLALSLAYYTRRALYFSALVLGLAAGVKLWPLALGPAWLLLGWRRARWAGFFGTGLSLAAGAAFFFLPLLPAAGLEVLGFLKYHADRGVQIGSTWASVALLLDLAGLYEAWTAHEFGAYHVKGLAGDSYARLSMYLLPVGVLLPQIGAFFGRLGRDDDDGEIGAAVTLGTVVGFMAFGKVLSPQFTLWLVPLIPLACRRVGLALVALAIAVGTTLEYPFISRDLEVMRAPGHTRAVLLIGARNALLVYFFIHLSVRAGWGAALRRLWRRLRRPRPPRARPPSRADALPETVLLPTMPKD